VRIWSMIIVPVVMILVDFRNVQATDEHRRAYDQMVEEFVRVADEYIQQKQREPVQRHAERISAEQRRAEEEAEMQGDEEDDGYSRGIIVVTPRQARSYGQELCLEKFGGDPFFFYSIHKIDYPYYFCQALGMV